MRIKFPNMKSNRSLFITMALSLGLALGAGLASAGSASAGGYHSGNSHNYGNGHYRGHNRNYKRGHRRHHVQRQFAHKRHYNHRNRSCGPRRAVNAAWNRGLNHPEVFRVKRNRVVVSGYQPSYYGSIRTKMVFDRWSNCRLIKTVSFR